MQNQSRAQTWHNQSPDKKLARRANKNLYCDVYPQDPKQEEDKMNSVERLTKGYINPQANSELESLIKVIF